jgi:hypothetical protein
LLAHGRWFSPGTPASSTTKTGHHDIAEILLKVALNTKYQNQIIMKTKVELCLLKSWFLEVWILTRPFRFVNLLKPLFKAMGLVWGHYRRKLQCRKCQKCLKHYCVYTNWGPSVSMVSEPLWSKCKMGCNWEKNIEELLKNQKCEYILHEWQLWWCEHSNLDQ